LPIGRFKRFLLFFRVHDDVIEVVRIIHGARDIPTALEGTP
jgi:plasmid stabilization system protein ParE